MSAMVSASRARCCGATSGGMKAGGTKSGAVPAAMACTILGGTKAGAFGTARRGSAARARLRPAAPVRPRRFSDRDLLDRARCVTGSVPADWRRRWSGATVRIDRALDWPRMSKLRISLIELADVVQVGVAHHLVDMGLEFGGHAARLLDPRRSPRGSPRACPSARSQSARRRRSGRFRTRQNRTCRQLAAVSGRLASAHPRPMERGLSRPRLPARSRTARWPARAAPPAGPRAAAVRAGPSGRTARGTPAWCPTASAGPGLSRRPFGAIRPASSSASSVCCDRLAPRISSISGRVTGWW